MFNPMQEKMLSDFRRILKEMPKEELQKKIENIKKMNFPGCSVEEYFENFSKGLIFEDKEQSTFVLEGCTQNYFFQPIEAILPSSELIPLIMTTEDEINIINDSYVMAA